jgi:hypothetical protein
MDSKNPTARRGSSRKIKTYYEKTGTKIKAPRSAQNSDLGCGGEKAGNGA